MSKLKNKSFQSDPIDYFIQCTPMLPLQEEKDVRNDYGAQPTLEIVPPLNPKPVDEAIIDAGKYIIKMQKKGFVKLKEDTTNPQHVYQSSLIKYKKLKKESEENVQIEKKPEKVLEPYQNFWLSLDVVKKAIKELNELQFENNYEHYEVENRFRDQVSTFVRVMNNDGMLDQKNKSKAELYSIMQLFVCKVREIRKNLIQNYLMKNVLLYSKLNKQQQKEFIKFKPKKIEKVDQNQDQNDDKLDSNFLKRIKQTSANFPKAYQFTGLGFEGFPPSNDRVKLQKDLKQLAVSMHSAVDKPPAPVLPNYVEETDKKTPRDDQSIPRKRVNLITIPKLNRKVGSSALSKRPLIKPAENANNISQNSALPKLVQKDAYSAYWDYQDPLAEARQGFAPNALKMIEELGQRSNKDYLKQYSSTEFARQLNKENGQSEAHQNQSELIQSESEAHQNQSEPNENQCELIQSESEPHQNQSEPNENQDETEDLDAPIQLTHVQKAKRKQKDGNIALRDNIFSTSIMNLRLNDDEILQNSSLQPRQNYLFDPKADDIQFLIQQSTDLENGDMSHAIYNRLETIWANLGFSVTQKLQMVIKYSESTEESSKLNSALKFWEEANNSAINYQKAYTAIKDFIKYSSADKSKTDSTVEDLKNGLVESEKNLLQVAKTLKSMFGDDLVFHGKKVDDIIKARRMKLKMIQGKVQSENEDQDD